MATKVLMPLLGESVYEGVVARWLKSEGASVEQYEPLLEIETDKVTTEATAEVAGTLLKIVVPEGETVEVGTVLAYIGQPGEQFDLDAESEEVPTPKTAFLAGIEERPETLISPARAGSAMNGGRREPARRYTGRISPLVSRIAAEHQVNLDLVPGTGRDGRITKDDILAYVEKQVQTERLPEPAGRAEAAAVPGETLPLSGMRRAIAEHMVLSKRTSPHVTTVFEFDFSAVAAHRAAHKARFARDGVNLTYTAYIVAAIARGLRAYPMVNSSWTEGRIQLKRAVNIGVATAVEDGLIVPVIKEADGLSLLGLARVINDLADRARQNCLQPEEVRDGTFTLTNHGVSGSLFATPIINQPQCAILGVGKIEKRVKVINDAIAIRPLAFASLTFDHRILDGAGADGFMSFVKDELENWS